MQPPTSTLTPRPAARAASSSSSRVLPTPASPAISPTAGRPRSARSSRPSRRSSSSARPTKPLAVVEVTPESMALRRTAGHAAALPLEDPAALCHEGCGAPLRIRPPCITKGTSASSARSSSGSPGTAITSARRPGAEGADPVLPAEQLGGDHGGRPDGGHRGHPVADHVGQLPGVPAVRVDAAVGAVGDPHAGLDRLGEAVALGLGGGLVLGQRLGRPALPRPPRRRCSRRCRCRRPGRCPARPAGRPPRRPAASRARWSGRRPGRR